MKEGVLKQLAIDFAVGNKAPIELEVFVDSMTSDERREFTGWMAHIAERASFVNRYTTQRNMCGSDQGHSKAVTAANKDVSKVRPILGFTVAKNNLCI